MEFTIDNNGALHVTLSRRNLLTLLAKLDGNPPCSACTITKVNEEGTQYLLVKAEEDEVHYKGKGRWPDRIPGEMHPDTERAIAKE